MLNRSTKDITTESVSNKPWLQGCLLLNYVLSVTSFCMLPTALANATEEAKTEWAIGLAAQVKEHAYLGYDRETQALPYLYIENSWMKLAGKDLDFKLGSLGDFSFSLRSKLPFGDGFDSSDSHIFKGMEDRDDSLWVGPAITWETAVGEIAFEALADALDNSGGQQASLQFSKGFQVSERIGIEPSFGVTWFSDKYVDYYYGVKASEARIDRPEYLGESTIVLNAGVSMRYSLNARQLIMLQTGIRTFDTEVEDSPLIENNTESSITLGYLYRFD
jgi:MipA family protein